VKNVYVGATTFFATGEDNHQLKVLQINLFELILGAILTVTIIFKEKLKYRNTMTPANSLKEI
jgi:hypothetical protein